MGRAGPGPVDYGFDRAGPGLGFKYMGPGWSEQRVGEPVANTALDSKWRFFSAAKQPKQLLLILIDCVLLPALTLPCK